MDSLHCVGADTHLRQLAGSAELGVHYPESSTFQYPGSELASTAQKTSGPPSTPPFCPRGEFFGAHPFAFHSRSYSQKNYSTWLLLWISNSGSSVGWPQPYEFTPWLRGAMGSFEMLCWKSIGVHPVIGKIKFWPIKGWSNGRFSIRWAPLFPRTDLEDTWDG